MKIRSIKYNFVMNAILTASTFIFPLITFPYISRVLLPYGVGKINFATSIVTYFTMFAMLGIPTYGVRACAQVRDDKNELTKVVHEILIINILMNIVTYVLYFLAVFSIDKLKTDILLFCIMSSTIILNTIGTEWLYKGLEQYSYITIRSIGFKVVSICLMFFFVKDQTDYIKYGVISIFAAAGSNILNFINLRNYITVYPVGGYHFRRHMKAILFFFLMSVATMIYTNMDIAMLGFMKDDIEVGYYSAAVKVKNILVSFVTSLGTVLLPRVSYYIEHGMKEQFLQKGQKALEFVLVTAFPIVIYFILYAKESILLLSGDLFGDAVLPMIIIMPTVLLIGITNILGIQILVPLGKEKKVFYAVLAGAVVDLIINSLCIPGMASSGAALGTLMAEIIVLIVQVIILKKYIFDLISIIQPRKIFIALVCSSVGSFWIKLIHMPLFLVMCISFAMFFGIYCMVLVMLKESFVYDFAKRIQNIVLR